MLLDYLITLLIPLVVFGIPVALGIRWLVNRRGALAVEPGAWRDIPTRRELATLADEVEALSSRLEDLDERQRFLERLLASPDDGGSRRLEPAARQGASDEKTPGSG